MQIKFYNSRRWLYRSRTEFCNMKGVGVFNVYSEPTAVLIQWDVLIIIIGLLIDLCENIIASGQL